jgi:cell division protein FtsN
MNGFLTRILIVSFVVLSLMTGCKKRQASDDVIYQPYNKPIADQVDSIHSNEFRVDSISVENDPIPEERGVDLSHRYFIVVASYSIRDLAAQRKDDMSKFGFNADVFMQNDDGWYKLAVESYKTRPEAEKALARIQRMGAPFDVARIVYNK